MSSSLLYTIIIDTREKLPHDFSDNKMCVATQISKLDTGDYTMQGWEDRLAIERKGGISEFATNITQKRFWNELERMKNYQYKYLLFEFFLGDILRYPQGSEIPKWKQKYIRITPSFIMSCIHRIEHEYGIPVVYCGNRYGAKWWMVSLFNFLSKKGGATPSRT